MRSWNNYTEDKLSKVTSSFRKKRVDLFINTLKLKNTDRILDLGSEDGSYLGSLYPYPSQITIADICEEPLIRGVNKYGFSGYKLINPDGPLPFSDNEFDVVWCNSTIEHVTINHDMLKSTDTTTFVKLANSHQAIFAKEISRISRKYFVQTPYLHFPIESHAWLPFIQYFPQHVKCILSDISRSMWIKKWTPDFYLYNIKRLKSHFPDSSMIFTEKAILPKSIIAIKQ